MANNFTITNAPYILGNNFSFTSPVVTSNFTFTTYSRYLPATTFSFVPPSFVVVNESLSLLGVSQGSYDFALSLSTSLALSSNLSSTSFLKKSISEVITLTISDLGILRKHSSISDIISYLSSSSALLTFPIFETLSSSSTLSSKEIYNLSNTLSLATASLSQAKVYSTLIYYIAFSGNGIASLQDAATIVESLNYLTDSQRVEIVAVLNSIFLPTTIGNSRSITRQDWIGFDDLTAFTIGASIFTLLNISLSVVSKNISTLSSSINILAINQNPGNIDVTINTILSLNTILKSIFTNSIIDFIDVQDNFLNLTKVIGTLLEDIKLSSNTFTSNKLLLTLLDSLLTIDSITTSALGTVSETIEFNLLLSSIRNSISELLEVIVSNDYISEGSIFILPLEEFLSIDSDYSIQSILQALLSDELLLVLPDISGSSNYFTYAFSPETSSTSSYTNYNFDGCCVFNSKYLFFDKSGIHEYGGNFDNGVPIQSEISTSALMYTTSNLKSVPSVYLGVVNSDTVILKVRTDGRGEFTYKLNKHTADLQTQKVSIGKGVIGRYFQFDLITSAEEFNLNSIEFLPLVLKRKI